MEQVDLGDKDASHCILAFIHVIRGTGEWVLDEDLAGAYTHVAARTTSETDFLEAIRRELDGLLLSRSVRRAVSGCQPCQPSGVMTRTWSVHHAPVPVALQGDTPLIASARSARRRQGASRPPGARSAT
jgi:hypothetical protein